LSKWAIFIEFLRKYTAYLEAELCSYKHNIFFTITQKQNEINFNEQKLNFAFTCFHPRDAIVSSLTCSVAANLQSLLFINKRD
jgi:hypothetical protein